MCDLTGQTFGRWAVVGFAHVHTTPGFYDDIPEAEYHADRDSLSVSGAKVLLKAPALFKWQQDHPVHKDVFDFGSAAHALVLGVGAGTDLRRRRATRLAHQGGAKEERDDARAEGRPAPDRRLRARRSDGRRALVAHLAMQLLSDGKPEVRLRARRGDRRHAPRPVRLARRRPSSPTTRPPRAAEPGAFAGPPRSSATTCRPRGTSTSPATSAPRRGVRLHRAGEGSALPRHGHRARRGRWSTVGREPATARARAVPRLHRVRPLARLRGRRHLRPACPCPAGRFYDQETA
jgi:hypothetical protein